MPIFSENIGADYQLLRRYWSMAFAAGHGDPGGLFKSGLRGNGLEWRELRPLADNDDARLIDWLATARSGRPQVRIFEDERDLRLLLVLDLSPSMVADCGRGFSGKAELALTVAFLLGFLALKSGDQVAWLVSNKNGTDYYPFNRSLPRLWQVRDMVFRQAENIKPGDVYMPLPALMAAVDDYCSRQATVIILSDYQTLDEGQISSLSKVVGALKQNKTIISLKINDPVERQMPKAGLLWFTDPITGEKELLDTSSADFRQEWQQFFHRRDLLLKQRLSQLGVRQCQFWVNADPLPELLTLFTGNYAKK